MARSFGTPVPKTAPAAALPAVPTEPEPPAAIAPAPAPAAPTPAPVQAPTPLPAPAPAPVPPPVQARQAPSVSEFVDPDAPAPPAGPSPIAFNASQQKTLTHLEVLQRNNPNYAGVVGKTVQFWKDEEAYIRNWKSTNRDQVFDGDAEEHADFYQREPIIDPDDLVDARVKDAENRSLARIQQVEAKVQTQEQAMRAQQVEAQAVRVAGGGVHEFVTKAAPELAKLMTVGGKLVVNDDTRAKAQAEMPAEYQILDTESGQLFHDLDELTKIDAGVAQIDGSKVVDVGEEPYYPHQTIIRTFNNLERRLQRQDANESVKDGKKFITTNERAEIIADIEQRNIAPEAKAKAIAKVNKTTWSVDKDMVREELINSRIKKTTKALGVIQSETDRRIAIKNGSSSPSVPVSEPAAAAQPISSNGHVTAPDTTSASDRTSTIMPRSQPNLSEEEIANRKMMGMPILMDANRAN